MFSLLVLPIFLQAATPAPSERTLRLSDAVDAAVKNHPVLQQARAQTSAAEGRLTQARAPFFPQVTATASYQRVRSASLGGRASTTTTGVGGTPSAVPTTDASGVNIYTFGGNATQLLWDFGTTYNRTRAASRNIDAFQASEKVASQNVVVDVRRSYFMARAQKALIAVAQESLTNLQRHLEQIQGFVAVGTRPDIDLAQARTDVANGRLALIDAQNAYDVAKAQLSRAMGLADDAPFDVADDALPPIDGEDLPPERLLVRAVASRPELASLEKQREAFELTAKAFRGQYWPTLSASAGASETGTALGDLGPAWNVGVSLAWPFFQGGLTHGQVREAEGNADLARAQGETEKVQIRLDVQQAQLGIRAAKASQVAAAEVVTNARERLRLAEGRYSSGVGSIIELGDAQLALTTASSQVVQADFRLSSARADLLAALGQR